MGHEDGVAFKSPFCRSFNHYLRNPKINGAAGHCEHIRGLTMSRTCLNRHDVGMLGTTTDTWEIVQMMFHWHSEKPCSFQSIWIIYMYVYIYILYIYIYQMEDLDIPSHKCFRTSSSLMGHPSPPSVNPWVFSRRPPVTSPSFPKGLVKAKGCS